MECKSNLVVEKTEEIKFIDVMVVCSTFCRAKWTTRNTSLRPYLFLPGKFNFYFSTKTTKLLYLFSLEFI